jgi:type II secretory pathway component PulK
MARSAATLHAALLWRARVQVQAVSLKSAYVSSTEYVRAVHRSVFTRYKKQPQRHNHVEQGPYWKERFITKTEEIISYRNVNNSYITLF